MSAGYKDRTGRSATPFVTKPARGAHIIKAPAASGGAK
jgi:hypothetical protein